MMCRLQIQGSIMFTRKANDFYILSLHLTIKRTDQNSTLNLMRLFSIEYGGSHLNLHQKTVQNVRFRCRERSFDSHAIQV